MQKRSAVDRVIEKLENEREEILRTINRLRAASAAAVTRRPRTPKAAKLADVKASA